MFVYVKCHVRTLVHAIYPYPNSLQFLVIGLLQNLNSLLLQNAPSKTAGSRRRCQVPGFMCYGCRFRVQGARFRVPGVQVPVAWFWMPGSGYPVPGSGWQGPCSQIRCYFKMSKTFTLFYVLTEITNLFYVSAESM